MFALLLAFFACSSPQTPATPEAPAAPATPSAPMAAPAASNVLHGTVAEIVPAGTYTYARATMADGTEVWAASTGTAPAVGGEVAISTGLPMRNFHSDTLKRDFPLVYFVDAFQAAGAPAQPAASGAALPDGHPAIDPSAAAQAGSAPSATPTPTGPPAGPKKVADVWSDRAALNGRQVTVSGSVVKSTPGVMGRNWLHIRDGSGNDGTNDLTVTSADKAGVGDQITATGVVQIDQDFGSGYTYPVMVSGASVSVTVHAGS